MALNNQDQVGGNHYTRLGIQPIEVQRLWFPKEQRIGFMRGNCLKYLARFGAKNDGNPLEDARKAKQYLEWLIEELEGKVKQYEDIS